MNIVENNNEDICVFDVNVECIVVIDLIGRVWFWYDGIYVKRKRKFSLRCIVIDLLN